MGRVSRYKKVKSIDPFAKNNTWTNDVGSTTRTTKRKSKTAQRLKDQKIRQRKGRIGAGANGLYDTGGYDLPPVGGDEFDLRDLVGSVKKQTGMNSKEVDSILEPVGLASQMKCVAPSSSLHVVKKGNDNGEGKKGGKSNKKNKQKKKTKQPATTSNGEMVITHKTPTNEIIAAHSNPKRKRANETTLNDNGDEDAGPSKQERRKAYLQEKKLKKKRKTTNTNDDDDDDEDVLALHRQQQQSSSSTSKQPKKHVTQQQNYSDTIRARSLMDDQVERPPTFSVLPRGAHKLSKHASKTKKQVSCKDEGDEQRIRKEQQALEMMRERVMRQYSALREKRRSGGV